MQHILNAVEDETCSCKHSFRLWHQTKNLCFEHCASMTENHTWKWTKKWAIETITVLAIMCSLEVECKWIMCLENSSLFRACVKVEHVHVEVLLWNDAESKRCFLVSSFQMSKKLLLLSIWGLKSLIQNFAESLLQGINMDWPGPESFASFWLSSRAKHKTSLPLLN